MSDGEATSPPTASRFAMRPEPNDVSSAEEASRGVSAATADEQEPLLAVEDLRVYFDTDVGVVHAVDGVSYEIAKGETLAIVGESGCGKSVGAMSILGLVPQPPARVASGRISFEGEDLLRADEARMRQLRGDDIAMIFQEPMSSLNPVYRVGDQIGESLILHRGIDAIEARERAIELLARVGIPAPAQRADDYPHQLSGGMCQRVMIAMALACDPKLLIADEPTTALDVTVQAQILELMRRLQDETGMSILLITHDLGVVAEMAHRVVVMYAGQVVERAPVGAIFDHPSHPYTAGLLHSLPQPSTGPALPLEPIAGNVPNALDFPRGCRFHPRCRHAFEPCRAELPEERERGRDEAGTPQRSSCHVVDREPGIDLLARRSA